MADISIDSGEVADERLTAVADPLGIAGVRYELVVIDGSALLALGLVSRATRDVDLVGLKQGEAIVPVDPLPELLAAACRRVARDFRLPDRWLNGGPTSLLELGLPEGFVERLHRREYGPSLTVHFASRLDQIHFKLYALVDHGPGKHEDDLRALQPTHAELLAAARWSRTHDPSQGYRTMLLRALAHLGVEDADVGG
jgi:hypothetical protein